MARYFITPEGQPVINLIGAMVTAKPVPQMLAHDCGTSGCLGGWLYSLWGAHNRESAGRLIGLGATEAYRAFLPTAYTSAWKATARQAAAMLRLFRETGRVDWAAVMEGAAE